MSCTKRARSLGPVDTGQHKLLLVALMTAVVAPSAFGHGGGLDANGCHHDRKNGGYHCHHAPRIAATSQRTTSAVANTAPISSAPTAQAVTTPSPPTCFTGPRGGRYTTTASGRKNYRGC